MHIRSEGSGVVSSSVRREAIATTLPMVRQAVTQVRCLPFSAVLILLILSGFATAHEDAGIASECLALEQADNWHIVNVCDIPIDMFWCMGDGSMCDWRREGNMRSGDSVATGVSGQAAIAVDVVACRRDAPFIGVWGSPDMEDGSIMCLAPHDGVSQLTEEIVTEETVTAASDANHCIEFYNEPEFSNNYMKNTCDYKVAVVACFLDGKGAYTSCGNSPSYYSPYLIYLYPQKSSFVGTKEKHTLIAACPKSASGLFFDPDGWDGKGGFACLQE